LAPPFFDLAWCIDPDFEVILPSRLPELVEGVANYTAKAVIPWYLKWKSLLGSRQVELLEPDPFEPLLLCFERGGRPFLHHGFLEIDFGAFPYGYGQWPDRFAERPATPLSEIDLTSIDTRTNARIGNTTQ
jgi:hypothetical protein